MSKQKIKFPKRIATINVAEDLGMDEYPGVTFDVWEDPSRAVVGALLKAVMWTEEQTDEEAEEFFGHVSNFIVDCNIEGVSFDTLDDVVDAFKSDVLPWGFLFELIVLLTARLLEKNEKIKKALMALSGSPDSGSVNENEEEE